MGRDVQWQMESAVSRWKEATERTAHSRRRSVNSTMQIIEPAITLKAARVAPPGPSTTARSE